MVFPWFTRPDKPDVHWGMVISNDWLGTRSLPKGNPVVWAEPIVSQLCSAIWSEADVALLGRGSSWQSWESTWMNLINYIFMSNITDITKQYRIVL